MRNEKKSTGTILTLIVLLCLMLATVLSEILFHEAHNYYLVSIIIVVCALFLFFISFENKKPQPRELVIIAVLCAVGVAGRVLFFWLPQFKPVAAIAIISGVAFGGQIGFLVGAVTGFVSNFYFGQGPWTPWQMLAFGFIGLLSGLVFSSNKLSQKRFLFAIYGALSTLVIYGGIVNLGTLLISTGSITVPSLIAIYLAGLPMDAIHAVSTFMFLLFISTPAFQILERIKLKYGFFSTKI